MNADQERYWFNQGREQGHEDKMDKAENIIATELAALRAENARLRDALKGALAALTQNATYPADVDCARKILANTI